MSAKTKVIQQLLTLLGFSAVATSCEFVGAPEYGCPSADYVFNVEVKDVATDTPIKGIRVGAVNRYKQQVYNPVTGAYEPTGVIVADTLSASYTSNSGKATIKYTGFPTNNHEIVAVDVDGDKNGGTFAPASVELFISHDDYEDGDDNWHEGTATTDVTIKLSRQEPQSEE